jgi:hypothetical protein
MTWWMWLIASLTVYGFGWYRTALMTARRINEKHERRWETLPLENYKREHMAEAMAVALVWPFYLPVLVLHNRMVSQVGLTPKELAEQNKKLEQQIARLEREAGIR